MGTVGSWVINSKILMTKALLTLLAFAFLMVGVVNCSTPINNQLSIVRQGAELEEIWNEGEFTEGVAVDSKGVVYFSDIPSGATPGRIYKFDPRTGEVVVHVSDSGKSNGLFFTPDGRLIACCGANAGLQALCEVLPSGDMKVLVERYQGKRLLSPNDLTIAQDGTVYFSDPRYLGSESMEIEHMNVYRWNPDSGIQLATTDLEKPNGLILSPDGKTLYVAETNNGSTGQGEPTLRGRMTLNAFPVKEDGSLGNKHVLVDFGKNTGIDGMTVDAAGIIYGAVRNENRFGIVAFSPAGEELAYIPTPSFPTNCTFGTGDTANILYLTAGGGLYKIRLNSGR